MDAQIVALARKVRQQLDNGEPDSAVALTAADIAYLIIGDALTWSVTITGEEEDDGEAPYVYVVAAEGESDAKRQALVHWCTDVETIFDPRKVEAARGMPVFGAYNDIRPARLDRPTND